MTNETKQTPAEVPNKGRCMACGSAGEGMWCALGHPPTLTIGYSHPPPKG
jgi:hypothetical protein